MYMYINYTCEGVTHTMCIISSLYLKAMPFGVYKLKVPKQPEFFLICMYDTQYDAVYISGIPVLHGGCTSVVIFVRVLIWASPPVSQAQYAFNIL